MYKITKHSAEFGSDILGLGREVFLDESLWRSV